VADETGAVSGRRLLGTLAAGAASSAVIGSATYYSVHFFALTVDSALMTQVIVAEVYSALIAAFSIGFPPLTRSPLAMCFTSMRDLVFAGLAWVGIVISAVVVYFLLSSITGSITDATRQLLTVATDVKRLEGQTGAAIWVVAIARGCLIVPVFEELFFRGLLFGWLRKRLSVPVAVTVSAVLFAAMHGYFIAMPYAFICGLFTGWIRVLTGSTLNTVFMHVLNNVSFLCLGFFLLHK
jgi:membrane protease YdiL (CAAX protease family)